ncbi:MULTISPECIES: hypothetical protein [unclassified Leptolyngbya]|uniref:hypothetical protein n=1 Tax=unclassified Leptolyngbya TaxID=2650499 RepID=UPI0016888E58|nr:MULTISPECIES: hypothetical protein [unclassified Leptolyngbya]MBD1911706.1 hypothetical protein [Leptolyngbya sp. FACHB-8]MBD2155541.1 hypothetical protein [Leptolyngbya sp. FACHB-16]
MTIKKYPLSSLQKVKKYLLQSLAVPNTEQTGEEQTSDEMPEPESLDELSGVFTFGGTPLAQHPPATVQDEWFVSTVNPGACFLKLPGLQMKPDYRLVSYLFRSQGQGVGVVWAVPEAYSTMTILEKALTGKQTMAQPPKPEKALEHFMEAVEGDRTPASFLMASILRRELEEFGAMGDRKKWGQHELIDAAPAANWNWRTAQPKDLWPKVKVFDDGQAAVEFFSCRYSKPRMLYRHLDQYSPSTYQSKSIDSPLAVLQ